MQQIGTAEAAGPPNMAVGTSGFASSRVMSGSGWPTPAQEAESSMAMTMTGQVMLPADRATVWAALNDAEILKRSSLVDVVIGTQAVK